MNEQRPDKRFEKLAKLVGDALARRWMQILAKRQAAIGKSLRRPSKGDRRTDNS